MIIKNAAELGKIIQKTRKSQDLTQTQLAAGSGVGVRFIVDLEKGKETAALGKTLKVIRKLGIDIELKTPAIDKE